MPIALASFDGVVGHHQGMRIEGSPGEPLATAYLWLTVAEAAELRDTLDQMLREQDFEGHHHVSSADFGTEVTVSLTRT